MKKLMITLLMILLPVAASGGECKNPISQCYETAGITVYFSQGYSSDDFICHVTVDGETQYIKYNWNQAQCEAELKTDPPIYLEFDEEFMTISMTPRFAWVTSVD